MKQLPQITSVDCKVRFLDSELQRVLYRQNEIRWFCKKRTEIISAVRVDGYETFASSSINLPLQGIVEICVANQKQDGVTLIEIPTKTYFLITCISRHNGKFFPAMVASLS